MAKILFFFTSAYPFGRGETFIENEIPFLSEAFDKIVIISNNVTDSLTRTIPENAVLERFSYELNMLDSLLSLKGMFKKLFWSELKIIGNVYQKKTTSIIVKTMLISLRKASVFAKTFEHLIEKHSTKTDEVYCYSYWANDMAFALTQYKKTHPAIKMVCRAHGWDVYFEVNKAQYLPFRHEIILGLDKVCFISQTGYNYYQNLFPQLSVKMIVSRLGVPKQFDSIASRKANTFTIVSCSNMFPVKRLHLIVEALSFINDFAVGWIHLGDGILFEKIQKQCRDLLSHKPNIRYLLKGYESNKDVISFYKSQQINAIINVSSSEGIPVSIMEAFSCGIPAIATDVGGSSEIVSDENGILLPANPTAFEIADAITLLRNLSDSQNMEMKQNAYRTWKEKFNSDNNYQVYVKQIV